MDFFRVRVVDASNDQPIPESEVSVVYTSGGRKGPVPANAAGVIIRTLPPGDVVVEAKATGYRLSKAASITLEGGKESQAVVVLERLPDSSE